MNGFNPALELTLNLAYKQAREKRHKFFTVEHLTLALLDNADVVEMLKHLPRADVEALRQKLSQFVDKTTPTLPVVDDNGKE